MWILKVLGGHSLYGDDGPVTGRPAQQRQLALLGLLASSHGEPVTRDKIIGLLWPEHPTNRARDGLNDCLYQIRKGLGGDAVITGSGTLRLNADRVASDRRAFEMALERGDLEKAVELYTGPFLDGFCLSDGKDSRERSDGSSFDEFERWCRSERERLARQYADALETLAVRAGASGDIRGSLNWWRRLAADDPHNSRVALKVMEAFEACGDPAGALRHAASHGQSLWTDFRIQLPPAIVTATNRLQRLTKAKPAPCAPEPAESVELPVSGIDTDDQSSSMPRATSRLSPSRLLTTSLAALFAIALLLLGTARWRGGAQSFASTRPAIDHAPVIAVLPFETDGPDESEYFADGLTDEVRGRLATLNGVHVIAAQSARRYRRSAEPLARIAKDLGADYLLTGRVRWQSSASGGTRVRVTPELVQVRPHSAAVTRWQQPFDVMLAEVPNVRATIAEHVAHELGITMTEGQRRALEVVPTNNMQAYDHYLRGLSHEQDARTKKLEGLSWLSAAKEYERAAALDSDFALAHVKLASARLNWWTLHQDSRDTLARAMDALERGERLAPDLAEAHAVRAGVALAVQHDFVVAARELRLAHALAPSDASVLVDLGQTLLFGSGSIDEAVGDLSMGATLDPVSVETAVQATAYLGYAGRYDLALAQADRLISLVPNQGVGYDYKARLLIRARSDRAAARAVLDTAVTRVGMTRVMKYLLVWPNDATGILGEPYERQLEELTLGALRVASVEPVAAVESVYYYGTKAKLWRRRQQPARAAAYCDSLRRVLVAGIETRPNDLDASGHARLGESYACMGRRDDAVRELKAASARARDLGTRLDSALAAHVLAVAYVALGDDDAAITQLERAVVPPGFISVAWLRVDPLYDRLRANPRFRALVGR